MAQKEDFMATANFLPAGNMTTQYYRGGSLIPPVRMGPPPEA